MTPDTFHIGVDDVNKCVKEVRQLVKENKSFAILMPVSITSEIARLENKDGQRCHDKDLAIKVSTMSKITLASSSEVWLINLPGESFNQFLSNDMEGLGLTGCLEVFQESLMREREDTAARHLHFKERNEPDCGDPIECFDETATLEAFPITRSKLRSDTTISTPAANNIISGERDTGGQETRTITPVLEHNKFRWKNVPKQPIPELQDISKWIGHQLNHKRMPKEYQNTPPDGKLISSLKDILKGY